VDSFAPSCPLPGVGRPLQFAQGAVLSQEQRLVNRTDVVVIGAGQAGLAMSRSLTARSIAHVVLERGRIGERWLSERWDSLRLLTPASHSALPGLPHAGVNADHFLSATDLADYLGAYGDHIRAPIVQHADVTAVEACAGGYCTVSTAGVWKSRAVVIATGDCDTPRRPACAAALSPGIVQVAPRDYRSPTTLPRGGVLIVGASSTGVQLAEEIHASGRPVTMAVGTHTRLPRRYRGLDIFAAMEWAGILDDLAEANPAIDVARRQPSSQLAGRDDCRDIDLAVLDRLGVRLTGRLEAIDGTRLGFRSDLTLTTSASHERMVRTLSRIDAAMDNADGRSMLSAPIAPFIAASAIRELDLDREGIRTVIWATGYGRGYPWLKVPVLDVRGEVLHRGGITPALGMYIMGLRYMRRRRSHFIFGCGVDAEELAQDIAAFLACKARVA
jgi:putative flavoprotein involved in K+ transport